MREVWGWWYSVVVDLLTGARASISCIEVRVFLDDLRNSYAPTDLPTIDLPGLDSDQLLAYMDHTFTHQMRWIGSTQKLMELAVLDYYRAYNHATHWVDNHLIGHEELDRFERRLYELWMHEREIVLMEMGPDADETQQRKAGVELYKRVVLIARLRVRERYDDPYFCRGKNHELADRRILGWHPDFDARLKALLGVAQ